MTDPVYIGRSSDGKFVTVSIGELTARMTPAVARNMAAILVNEARQISQSREVDNDEDQK